MKLDMSKRTESVRINGGKKLVGVVGVQGSKNAVLPIIAASVLNKKNITLRNVPHINDVQSLLEILASLGMEYTYEKNVLKMNGEKIKNTVITDELTSKLRASSLLLGPLLARFHSCGVGMPGGCSIGPRPLNYHFEGFEQLGANIIVEEGIVKAKSKNISGEFTLPFPSVGATQNLISSSVLSKGKTFIHNVAVEPEVMALIDFLNESGAKIEVFDTNSVKIIGVDSLKSVEYTIPSDRIEAITLLCAGAVTKGDITVRGIEPKDLHNVLQTLSNMGLEVTTKKKSVRVRYVGKLNGTTIRTGVHPAFPTDAQAQFSVLMTRADTMSMITENVFNNRFQHLEELIKMSADITIEKNVAVIQPSQLSGCRVQGYELRGTASMIIAGLIAKGTTRVDNLKYMYRGYECFVEKLNHLGAEIYYI